MTTVAQPEDPDMSLRSSQLVENIAAVTRRIASSTAASAAPSRHVRLVAVSKLKPIQDILALHNPPASQLHFGENYLQELLDKSKLCPPTIRWHFIGGLQSNKCVTLARDVRGLWAVESVDSEKKASLLNKGYGERVKNQEQDAVAATTEEKLRIFVQVNTSGEENKSGVEPSDAVSLCRFVLEKCPNLKLQGLMTIGAIARSKATTAENENEDFICLRDTRDRVVKELELENLELSMGMSEDFEGAIALGSDQVRVGSTIFGTRPPKSEAKIVA
ncbi:hypothetical protein KEM56_006038 [Ascosphaera pollenicola]|nr:hypothetical protein KEM56_006038 [Ascosphaera pollenicola]